MVACYAIRPTKMCVPELRGRRTSFRKCTRYGNNWDELERRPWVRVCVCDRRHWGPIQTPAGNHHHHHHRTTTTHTQQSIICGPHDMCNKLPGYGCFMVVSRWGSTFAMSLTRERQRIFISWINIYRFWLLRWSKWLSQIALGPSDRVESPRCPRCPLSIHLPWRCVRGTKYTCNEHIARMAHDTSSSSGVICTTSLTYRGRCGDRMKPQTAIFFFKKINKKYIDGCFQDKKSAIKIITLIIINDCGGCVAGKARWPMCNTAPPAVALCNCNWQHHITNKLPSVPCTRTRIHRRQK